MSNPSTHVSAKDACAVAMGIVDRIQTLPKGTQVAGVFFLAKIMQQQLGLDLNEVMNQAERRYDVIDTFYQREAQAISDYTNGELR